MVTSKEPLNDQDEFVAAMRNIQPIKGYIPFNVWRGCTDKKRHASLASAQKEATRLNNTPGPFRHPVVAYACTNCFGFHVGGLK